MHAVLAVPAPVRVVARVRCAQRVDAFLADFLFSEARDVFWEAGNLFWEAADFFSGGGRSVWGEAESSRVQDLHLGDGRAILGSKEGCFGGATESTLPAGLPSLLR